MEKKQSFMHGIVALMLSQVIIKILGMVYSLYLTNKNGFGDTGNAIYMSGYQIYALFLTVSSMGVPNAIAKLIAEKIAKGDERGADRIFKVAFITFALFGFIGTLILFTGANFIAKELLQIPKAEFTLLFLSPAIFFVAVSAVIEGYFNGRKEIYKTARAQSIEQFLKMTLTISIVEFVAIITGNNTEYMAAGANLATSFATAISFLYLCIVCIKSREKYGKKKFTFYKEESIIKIIKNILKVSIPLSIGSLLIALNKNIDSMTVVRILKPILGEQAAQIKYGILSSKVDILIALPLSFNMAFSVALIPEIATAKIQNRENEASKKISFSLLITTLIGLPSAVGMYIFAEPILNLLFPNANQGAELLRLGTFAILLELLSQTINGALQGLGKIKTTTIALAFGTIIKLICNIYLIPVEGIYEKGAILSTICCYIVIFCIGIKTLIRNVKLEISVVKNVIKPILATINMGFFSYIFYIYVSKYLSNAKIITIITILMAIFIYIINIILLKIFSKEELILLPKGDFLCKILKKCKIYR